MLKCAPRNVRSRVKLTAGSPAVLMLTSLVHIRYQLVFSRKFQGDNAATQKRKMAYLMKCGSKMPLVYHRIARNSKGICMVLYGCRI